MTNKIKVVIEVELDNENDWIGIEDCKDARTITDLDVFNRMVELENTTAFKFLMELGASEKDIKSKFLGIIDDGSEVAGFHTINNKK